MAKSKLDIFEILRHIDDGDFSYYRTLSEEDRKGFVPVVAMRWLSGTPDPDHLIMVNELVNSTVFNLYKHPDLLYELMVAATPRGRTQYNWIKTAKKSRDDIRVETLMRYLEASEREAVEYLSMYNTDDLVEMAEGLGETNDYIKKLKAS